MRHRSTPWFAENIPGGFVVRDAERKPVAYVYGRDRPQQTEGVPNPLTIDEARVMALSIAKLATLLQESMKPSGDMISCPPPPGAGKVAKRSRFDATPPPHSIHHTHPFRV